jgi:hypothetical protein
VSGTSRFPGWPGYIAGAVQRASGLCWSPRDARPQSMGAGKASTQCSLHIASCAVGSTICVLVYWPMVLRTTWPKAAAVSVGW